MPRSIFGWDLPPGCTMRDIEDACGGDDDHASETEDVLTLWLEAAPLRRCRSKKATRRLENIEDEVCQIIDKVARERDNARESLQWFEIFQRQFETQLRPVLRAIVTTGTVSPDARDAIEWFLDNSD